MTVAYQLAPDNRYVLRCAARFAIYRHDPGRAQRLLAASQRLRTDPWLLAAEIATADAADERSRHIRTAQQLVGAERFSDFELAELRAALGTLEAHAGDDRAARRLFRQALNAPTDNAIAQAEWASQHINGLEIAESAFAQPRTWEARALDAAGRGDWREAVSQARSWLDDQPFARRPAEFGSYHASAGRDFEAGAELAKKALISNPGEFLLANNAAFCLASLNRVAEAQRAFDQISWSKLNAWQRAVYLATKGLLAYRSGKPDVGRELYRESITAWRGQEKKVNRILALIMLAREELLVRAAGAMQLAEEAQEASSGSQDPDLGLWIQQVQIVKTQGLSGPTDPSGTIALARPVPRAPQTRSDL